jgi:hypothetical protein
MSISLIVLICTIVIISICAIAFILVFPFYALLSLFGFKNQSYKFANFINKIGHFTKYILAIVILLFSIQVVLSSIGYIALQHFSVNGLGEETHFNIESVLYQAFISLSIITFITFVLHIKYKHFS